MKSIYFKDWVTGWDWGARIALFLLLMCGLVQLGMFVLTQNYMVSYLGAQPEDIWFGVMATYAGIITILPIQFRFLRYFETRSYLLFNILMAILLNFICLHCQDIYWFLTIRFLQGIFAGNLIVCTVTMIFSSLLPERSKIIGSAIFYGTMLGNTVLIALVAGVVVESADWKVTYYWLMLFQAVTMIVVLVMLKNKIGHKRYPLYQIDWVGTIIFAFTSLGMAYTMLYGSKYYWFEDRRICCSSLIAFIGIALFLYRQYLAKRPTVHLEAFKSKNFIMGLCLLSIYYGSKDTMSLIYNYTGGILKWSTYEVIMLALCNLIGIIGFLIVSIRLIVEKKMSVKAFFVPGFTLLAIFNFWMSFLLTADLSFTDLLVPVFVQGAASGLLFAPIMIFVLSSAPGHTGPTGLIIAAYTRFTTTLNSFTGFYNLQLYYNQYFKEGFLGYVTQESQNTVERLNLYRNLFISKGFAVEQASVLAQSTLAQSVAQQTQLLASRAIFMLFGIVLLVVAILLVVLPAIGKSFVVYKKRTGQSVGALCSST